MKLYWKYTLPKQQFRPFDHFAWGELKDGEEITDKCITIRSQVDKALNLGWAGQFISIIATIFYIPVIIGMFIDFHKALEEPEWIFSLPIIIVFGMAIYVYAQRTNIKKYNVFDRENGKAIHHMGWPRKRVFNVDWKNCDGELWFNRGRYGRSEFSLWLHDNESNDGFLLSLDVYDPETVLRHWSFLVQYMDKTKPLPDTPNFKDYPDRTTGLWTEQAWAFESCRKGFDDPYDVWLKESMEKQKQDENETLRKSGRMVDTGRG